MGRVLRGVGVGGEEGGGEGEGLVGARRRAAQRRVLSGAEAAGGAGRRVLGLGQPEGLTLSLFSSSTV